MTIYNIWFNLREGILDIDFVDHLYAFLDGLKHANTIRGYRLMRRKLGLAPLHLAEFHLMIEVEDLAQLDAAFNRIAARTDPVESNHWNVNRWATDLQFALYRDFPDPVRVRGQEQF